MAKATPCVAAWEGEPSRASTAGPDEALRAQRTDCCGANSAHREAPRIRRAPPFWRGPSLRTHLSTNTGNQRLLAFALLSRLLALTARILLLLSGLLSTALLLARLLSGVLILLAGILVLTGHCDLPCSSRKDNNRGTRAWLRGTWFSISRLFSGLAKSCGSRITSIAVAKTISAQAFSRPSGGVAAMGSRC